MLLQHQEVVTILYYQLSRLALPPILENMEVVANKTVEITNRPDMKLKMPVINSEPIRMSLFSSVISFSNPIFLQIVLTKRLCFAFQLLCTIQDKKKFTIRCL